MYISFNVEWLHPSRLRKKELVYVWNVANSVFCIVGDHKATTVYPKQCTSFMYKVVKTFGAYDVHLSFCTAEHP